nr:TonB-dependent receptor [uncultured Desulfobacter sp.]
MTATKFTTQLDKIPTNISLISREELDKFPGHYNAITVLEAANIPGLFFSNNVFGGGSASTSISTRGSEVSSWGMKVMINGIELNRGNGNISAGRMAVHDIERIEITKTPSAEYGDQATGGVINIITRAADKPVEGKAGIAFTSLGGGNGYSVINGTRDQWEYYIDASAQREDTYQDKGFQDGNNVYTRVGYALNNGAQLTFHGSYNDTKGLYAAGLTRDQFNEDSSQNPNTGADYDYESEDILGAMVYKQQLGRHELMAKMEVQTCDYQLYWGHLTHMDSLQAHPEVNVTFSNDISDMANKLVIGGEYRYHDYDVNRYTASSFHDVTAINQDFTRKDISYAGYVQDELQVTDALTVTAGLRYDFFDLEQNAHIMGSDSWDQETGDISPKLGFTYQFCDELNLFAGYNSGIKSPVRLPVYYTNGQLEPEKLRAFELGIRGNVAGWFNYNMALFRQTVKDKFVLPSADWTAQYENAGETSSKGIEIGAGAKLPHGFYTSANFTYQDAKFEEFVSMGVDYSGNKLTGVPDIIFAFTLGYRNQILGDFSLNPVYMGRRYFNYANTNEEDGYWVLNARYLKKIGRLELYLTANNLFDKSAVGDGSGNPGSESLYPISGFNTVIGMNVAF